MNDTDRCTEFVYEPGAFHSHQCYRMAVGVFEGKAYCKMHLNAAKRRMGIVDDAVGKYYPCAGTIFLLTGTMGKKEFSSVTSTDVLGSRKWLPRTRIPVDRVYDTPEEAAKVLMQWETDVIGNLKQQIYEAEWVIEQCKKIVEGE